MPQTERPIIIQGGMGVGISHWGLARAVAIAGEQLQKPTLGVVSGTGAEILLVRRLQRGDRGDPGGHMQKGLKAFPVQSMAERIIDTYVTNLIKPPRSTYRLTPKPTDVFSTDPERRRTAIELSIVANFVEVWCAKQGHQSPIGINHLEKIQFLHPYRLYGAMLAGVDYVLEGAGIPIQVPGLLDGLAKNQASSYRVDVVGSRDGLLAEFDPAEIIPDIKDELKRPDFLAVIASNTLAKVMVTKASGYVDGFVIEGPTAGGHNAPPRVKNAYNERGEPLYGDRDLVNLDEIKELGRPFWLAGSYASPEKIIQARGAGAEGVQLGTIFALSNDSGMDPIQRQKIRKLAISGNLDVFTSPLASPTGFPFKVVQLKNTLSEPTVYSDRIRACDIGHLVEAFQGKNGTVWRCAAEPISAYLQKTGKALNELAQDERDRLEKSACLCNGLVATAGFAQEDKHGVEPMIVTLGDNTDFIGSLVGKKGLGYSAKDAIAYLLQV